MRMPWYPWSIDALYNGRPNVGWLMDLCEENYRYVLKLAPDLKGLRGRFISRGGDDICLYLEVLEQTPYTTLIHLTYYFAQGKTWHSDPDATLRIYHDSGQAEVVDLRQRSLPLDKKNVHSSLDQKWKLNLFLAKWLAYCVQQGHCFKKTNALSLDDSLVIGEMC